MIYIFNIVTYSGKGYSEIATRELIKPSNYIQVVMVELIYMYTELLAVEAPTFLSNPLNVTLFYLLLLFSILSL